MKVQGRIWKFGDDIDTDIIIPARYINISDGTELAKHCFADYKPNFAHEAGQGAVIVAGNNFGCGSSREHAPLALKYAGVKVVIAKSFARIFYRSAFNIGLPLLESDEAFEKLAENEEAVVDLANGTIEIAGKGTVLFTKPIPPFMAELISAGGLVASIRKHKLGLDG